MQDHQDGVEKKHRSSVENYDRVHRTSTANWLMWVAIIYMPFALYLGFVARPLVWLLDTLTSADPQQLAIAQLFEIIAWVALPLIGAIVIYYRMVSQKG